MTGDIDILDGVRIGDAERGRAAAILQQACGLGLLTLTEADARQAAAYAARTQADLDRLLTDLPPALRGDAPPEPAAAGRPRPARLTAGTVVLLVAVVAIVAAVSAAAATGRPPLLWPLLWVFVWAKWRGPWRSARR